VIKCLTEERWPLANERRKNDRYPRKQSPLSGKYNMTATIYPFACALVRPKRPDFSSPSSCTPALPASAAIHQRWSLMARMGRTTEETRVMNVDTQLKWDQREEAVLINTARPRHPERKPGIKRKPNARGKNLNQRTRPKASPGTTSSGRNLLRTQLPSPPTLRRPILAKSR
jgi:hypothetical protein